MVRLEFGRNRCLSQSTAFSEQGLQLSAIPLGTAQDYDRNPKIISAEGAPSLRAFEIVY